MIDIAIVGGGPAGLTAGIYALRAGLSAAAYEKTAFGGKITQTDEVDNYPGFPSISGFELAEAMRAHAANTGLALFQKEFTEITKEGDRFLLTAKDETVEARAVIYAAGGSPRPLGVPGEEAFRGRGVSYCATCDGAFFRKRTTVVVGGGNTAVEDALYLSALCDKVYLVHRRDAFRAEKHLTDRLAERANITLLLDTVVTEIVGDGVVSGVSLRHVKTGELSSLSAAGVFVAVGQSPDTALIAPLADLAESGHVRAGEDTKTRTPGLFVAGDCREKPLYQIVTAVADGGTAATAAIRYLQG